MISEFMDIETVFKAENIDLLFEAESHYGDFIAAVDNGFSEYMDRKEFDRDWAWSFPAGRYVINVFQRCCVFKEGKLIWQNNDRLKNTARSKTSCFVIVLDQKLKYTVPSWGRTMLSYFVRDKKDHLHYLGFPVIEKAGSEAQRYSEHGFRAAVLESIEDYNMF